MFSFKTLATIVLPSLVAASCMHGTSHMKRQLTSSNTVAISNFGYSGLQGPLNWAGLSLANSACATSAVQSPINIDSTIGLAEVKPVFEAPDVEEAEIENLGTTVEVVMEGLGAKTTVGDVEFEVKQFHFHTPSEHRIAEEYSVMEMHIVHEGPNGELAVIAVPFDFVDDGSSTTSLLTSVFENLADVTVPGSVSKTGALSFSEVVSHLESSDIFQYTGSLTTPPCAEGLTFFVAKEPMPIDVQTFSAVKKVIKFNARFTQNTLGNFNLLTVASSVDKFLVQNPVAAVAKKEGDEIVVDKEENVEGEGEVVEDNNRREQRRRRRRRGWSS
ncbi:carbonic anhydrase [Atractiella rhizophila]|nr:carbonic anhydrase [Atractiella rhizophila]